MITYLLFLAGFVLLTYGASFLVDGASAIAKKYHISDLVIGLTIVALGTSLPELIVSVFSSSQGSSDIAIGNVLGSNIFNTLFILGFAAMVYPIVVQSATVKVEIPLSILAAIIIGILANDLFLVVESPSISRIDGIILLLFFAGFLYYTFRSVYKNKEIQSDVQEHVKQMSILKSLLLIGLGLIGLVIGGRWIVSGAIEIARTFKISESIIGLTIVAAGTSLPELATSAVASFKRNSDIAIGNVVGSNIFNIFFILGTSALINPLTPAAYTNVDIGVTVFSGILLLLFTLVGKNRKISRFEGFLFIVIYIGYIIYLIGRG